MASGGQWTPRAAARELQLPPAADEALVKKRYRELAKQLHPDRNKGNEAAATEAFQRLSGAYDRLSADFGRAAADAAAIARHRAAAAAARRQADWERAMGGPAVQQPANPGPRARRKAEAAAAPPPPKPAKPAKPRRARRPGEKPNVPTSCLLYTSPSPRDYAASRMPSSA